ncbi:hypothetical protein LCGC14_2834220, partial [marine sediment metagenome]
MLVDQNDPDFVLFTQKRFCQVIQEFLDLMPRGKVEITVPRGAKTISLILQ